jgi:hypothetical protein
MVARDIQSVDLATTVSGVIDRLREIDAELPADGGVAIFNRIYLTVAERIAAVIADPHRWPDHVSRIRGDGRARCRLRKPLVGGRRPRRGTTGHPAWRFCTLTRVAMDECRGTQKSKERERQAHTPTR